MVGTQIFKPELAELVGQWEKAKELSSSQIAAVLLAGQRADERYFDLKENNVDETVWINWFKNARLASAICAAYRDDSWESSGDALYELSVILRMTQPFQKL